VDLIRLTSPRPAVFAAAAMAAGLLLSGCGGAATQGAENAAAADPASAAGATGSVNICGGKDASGIYKGTAAAFTTANGKVTAKYTEIGATTDEARTQAVQRLEGKSTECDIFVADVIWTSEFASQGWLLDQTKLVETNMDRLIPSTVETAKYEDKYWASPFFTNAGLVYYQKGQGGKARDLAAALR
jgi:multiple sugar transport system substrate-binding protein